MYAHGCVALVGCFVGWCGYMISFCMYMYTFTHTHIHATYIRMDSDLNTTLPEGVPASNWTKPLMGSAYCKVVYTFSKLGEIII